MKKKSEKPASQEQSLIFPEEITVEPLSKKNWDKFVDLFGERGACANCWCMFYRLPKAEFDAGKKNDGNKNGMKSLVWSGKPAGMIAIYREQAIAWCAMAPREDFSKLERSRVHKRIDDKPVWSIPCFFIHKTYRKKGLSVVLLKKIMQYARENKIPILEAYPVIPTTAKLPDSFAWIGLYKSFERAGFEIVDRTSKNRPMVRYFTNKMK
jgi:GNAT superfamily N-acetyltransferase